ncbi:MAG: S41 family peptidase [Cyclobacteriaceae bacterium]|nr:S41 family peptidase [Cyclobacteriaceae bacterium]
MSKLYFLVIVLFYSLGSCAQEQQKTIDTKVQKSIIDFIAKQYNKDYVFPEVAEKMGKFINSQLAKGSYAKMTPTAFATQLTEDMRLITGDRHVMVNYVVKGADDKPTNSISDFQSRFPNYGFQEVKVLDGNIGYIDIRIFFPVNNDPKSKETVRSSLAKLNGVNALIFDVRKCGGGSADMINLLISYLYPQDSIIHLNTFYYRPTNATYDSHTLPNVDGERFERTPVYVLTGARTFSAAEEFSYDLKNLKRATLVGASTGGGANTVEPRKINDDFEMFVPTGRAINPITKTNWEGVGVKPDIEVEEGIALKTAQMHAVMQSMAKEKDSKVLEQYKALVEKLKSN